MPTPSGRKKQNKTRLSKTMSGQQQQQSGSSTPVTPQTSSLADFVEFVSTKFDAVDVQQRGYIASGQLRALLEQLGAAPQPLDQVRSIALLLDPEYSDKIKKQDFLRFWVTREMAPQHRSNNHRGHGGGAGRPGHATTQLVADLSEAARARKEAQENAKMLANRVAMLREEKLKTIRTIADANRQAAKITERKRKQEERRLERREILRRQEQETKRAQKTFAARKKLNMQRKAQKSEEIYKQKMEIAAAVRREKQAAQRDKKRLDKQYQNRARQTRAGVQKTHRHLKQQKVQLAKRQQAAGVQAYKGKIKKEEKLRRKNERSIKALEEEEAGLIQELQNAQLMQEDALSGLQYLLSTRVIGTE